MAVPSSFEAGPLLEADVIFIKRAHNPIIPLDAKNNSNTKPKESRADFGSGPRKLSQKFIRFLLYLSAGMMSFIKLCSWILIVFLDSSWGISVNRNRQVGGMDMIKL